MNICIPSVVNSCWISLGYVFPAIRTTVSLWTTSPVLICPRHTLSNYKVSAYSSMPCCYLKSQIIVVPQYFLTWYPSLPLAIAPFPPQPSRAPYIGHNNLSQAQQHGNTGKKLSHGCIWFPTHINYNTCLVIGSNSNLFWPWLPLGLADLPQYTFTLFQYHEGKCQAYLNCKHHPNHIT